MVVYLSRKAEENKNSSSLFLCKLIECFKKMDIGFTFDYKSHWDVGLALINLKGIEKLKKPIIQRLDGIYFNLDDDSMSSNKSIKSTYVNSKGVIFQSSLAKKIVSQNFGSPPNKHIVINNGTFINDTKDPESAIKSELPDLYKKLSQFPKRIISVAKWRQIKRLPSVVNGSLNYIKKNNDTCLLLIGPMSKEDAKKYSNLSKNIICLGQVSNNTVRNLQILSHCCLNLSFTDSCPSTVVEAAAHGTPCVITKNQGVTDIIKHNEHGVILDVDNWNYQPISYNKSIKQIDPNIVSSAIEKCIQIGKLPFRYDLDIKQTAEKYVQFIRECI